MSFSRRLVFALIAALLTTPALYWIDDDPPYANRLQTLAEFAIITVVLSSLFLGISCFFRKKAI